MSKRQDKYLKYKNKYFVGFKYKWGNHQKQVPDFMDNVILLMTLEEAEEAQKDLAKFKIEAEICEL